jgi:hypothetical protein
MSKTKNGMDLANIAMKMDRSILVSTGLAKDMDMENLEINRLAIGIGANIKMATDMGMGK